MRYAFYISGKSDRLLKAIQKLCTKDWILVVSDAQVDCNLKKLIESNNLTLEVIDDCQLVGTRKKKNLLISNFILKQLEKNNIDYLFSFGEHLLSGKLLEKYNYRLINFHPSLLPMFPGIRAIDQAVDHGNTLLVGNTAHFIDDSMDNGKIIMQSIIPLKAFLETHDYDSILDLQIDMLERLVKIIDEHRLKIVDGEVDILGADYKRGSIYPFI